MTSGCPLVKYWIHQACFYSIIMVPVVCLTSGHQWFQWFQWFDQWFQWFPVDNHWLTSGFSVVPVVNQWFDQWFQWFQWFDQWFQWFDQWFQWFQWSTTGQPVVLVVWPVALVVNYWF
ncbi:hypothetical protein BJ912DRAFT_937115 [Pholiota molesta]|nr:hypothetical protein BJ912DRAFT_937115 [Pholiota molesta]